MSKGKRSTSRTGRRTRSGARRPPAKAKTKAAWTFLVYMAGDNNLDPDGVRDLMEMKKVGSTPQVNVVVEFDRSQGHTAKRYYIRKGGKVSADAVASAGKIDTGDPKCLINFVQWAAKKYPAERTILVLWNHGQGWDDTDIYADERLRPFRRLASGRIRHALFHSPVRRALERAPRVANERAILLDDNAKDFLDNQEMKGVITTAAKTLKHKVDILGMDACLMSMAEVGYQLRGGAQYTVGSEETEPLDGWPYNTILAALTKTPAMTSKDLSALIVSKYLASYGRDAVTQSACDLSRADALATAVQGLAQALTAGLADPAVRDRLLRARTQVQSYEVPDNVDLVDYCELVENMMPASVIGQHCRDVIQAARAYVTAKGAKGDSMSHSNGVAIYFPTQAVSPLYSKLDFSVKTGWDAFLNLYLEAMRRR
jgi:hypothetical protein